MAGAFALSSALFFVSGCNSKPIPDPMAEAVGHGERPVAMKGTGNYFGGRITAIVTVSRGFSRDLSGNADKPGSDRDRKRNGDSTKIQGMGDSYPTGFQSASDTEQREMYEDMVRVAQARRAAGSPMPPVTIRLKLENRSGESLDVELLEVNSDLGNFAVRPTKLNLPPAQAGEADPMVSQLGVTADDIRMTVTLRIGGKKEQQIIPVRSVFIGMEKK